MAVLAEIHTIMVVCRDPRAHAIAEKHKALSLLDEAESDPPRS